MCGIAGIIGSSAVAERWLDVALGAMFRRGPDGEGRYVNGSVRMGMRRLAIIDVSGGTQPLRSRGGRVVAFQNGEIYNYRGLRDELERAGFDFITHSDTEVLAHGYTAWGIQGLMERVDGMCAVAIFDEDSRCLHLARDRFGEKPLFVVRWGTGLAYGSQLTALATIPEVDQSIDLHAASDYLALHFICGDETIIRGVRRVLPGQIVTVQVDTLTISDSIYYRIDPNRTQKHEPDRLAALLEDAVKSRLVADVPVGVFLSGGLDSSVVTAIAARTVPKISTFSMGFNQASHDESEHARAVAAHVGSDHHHFQFDADRFLELLPQVAAGLDEPIGDQALLPTFWLCHEARKHVTVALSGEGADEVFAGYGYYKRFAQRLLARGWLDKLLGRSPRSELVPLEAPILGDRPPETPSGFPLLTSRGDRAALVGTERNARSPWERKINAMLMECPDGLQRATMADLLTWLPDDLLIKLDRMAMANSLEGRAPYLAPSVVEYGMTLPVTQRIAGATVKVALRDVADRWLPKNLVERPKQGFVLPMRDWLREWLEAREGTARALANLEALHIDTQRLTQIVENDLRAGLQRERLIFALVMLSEWWRHHANTVKRLQQEMQV